MNQKAIDAITIHDDKNIKGFFGTYRWLSNFHPVQITYEGITYPSTENAYVASKLPVILDDPQYKTQSLSLISQRETITELKKMIALISPAAAKKHGGKIILREDWDSVKLGIMENLTRIKYQDPVLRQQLLDTGDKYIEETNWWGDKFWGVCRGVGENHLGKIIMKIREENKLYERHN